MNNKLNDVLGSRNFFVSIISTVLLIFQMNGTPIDDVDTSAGEIYDALKNGGLIPILSIILPNVLNPIMKIIQGGFKIDFIYSINFWVQAITVGLIVLGGYGVVVPDGTAAQIVESVFAGEWGLLITVLIANIFNPIYHIFFRQKDDNNNAEMIGLTSTTAASQGGVKGWLARRRRNSYPVLATKANNMHDYILKQHDIALRMWQQDSKEENKTQWMQWVGMLKTAHYLVPNLKYRRTQYLTDDVKKLVLDVRLKK